MPVTKCSIKRLCRVALFLVTSLVAGAAQAFSAYGLDAAGDTAPMNQQQQAQQQQYQLKQQLQLQRVQQHQQSVDSTRSSAEEGRESACEQLKTDPALDPIRGKIAIGNEKNTPEMVGNIKTPSNIEGESLKIYAQTDALCIFQTVVAAFPGMYSTQSEKDSLYSRLLNEEYKYIEPLIQGKISYGRYNEEMINIVAAMQSALSQKTQNSSVYLPAQVMTSDQSRALAKSAYQQKDATALAQLRAAAQSGDANAQFNLGTMYLKGRGVPQDYAQALSWFHKAAEQGNAFAQNNLGFMYYFGQGVPEDYAQAAYWYRKAAEQGVAMAQYNLGVMYTNGRGVPQDYAQAAYWYRKTAEQGDADAQTSLGFMYEHGQGVPQDYAQAAYWYRKAAEQGNAFAQFNLGIMYANGQGVPQDYAQAAAWFSKAAEQGNAFAQYNLGVMYANGRGVPQDYAQAIAWYRKAAEQGNALAQYNLGVMYAFGQGVPQDYVIAYALFNLSATGDQSSDNPATNNRSKLAARMTPQQIAAGQELTRRMMKIGVLKAIDSDRRGRHGLRRGIFQRPVRDGFHRIVGGVVTCRTN
jgi:hypothetical protein